MDVTDTLRDRSFCDWFVGFVDGEGCFHAGIRKNPSGSNSLICRFSIGQRSDNGDAIWDIWDKFPNVGNVSHVPHKPHPLIVFNVHNIKELHNTILPFFRNHPLRTKKQKDFELFAQIVDKAYDYQVTAARRRVASHTFAKHERPGRPCRPPEYWAEIEPLVQQLSAVKKFPEDERT